MTRLSVSSASHENLEIHELRIEVGPVISSDVTQLGFQLT